MAERWRMIHEFPKYDVSDCGRVRRRHLERPLRLQENQQGVITVGLMGENYKQYRRSVPLLVATAFLRRTKIMEEGNWNTPICLNGDRTNNHVDNLEWRPFWFARQYNRQFREPYEHPIMQPIREVGTELVWPNSFEVCRHYGLLERDLVLSILEMTYVWPIYRIFEVVS